MKDPKWMVFGAGFLTCFVLLLGIRFFFGQKDVDPGRIEQLLRDSLDHAGWAERRDEQRDSINLAFKLKDDTLSWTREELEYALRHRRPSRLGDDSLLREVRRAVGDLP